MKNTIYIFTPEQPENGFGAFSQCQNIEQPKEICQLCNEREAEVEVVFNDGRFRTEVSCMYCYAHPDYQTILKRGKLISVKKL
jgi:hypothetical protein